MRYAKWALAAATFPSIREVHCGGQSRQNGTSKQYLPKHRRASTYTRHGRQQASRSTSARAQRHLLSLAVGNSELWRAEYVNKRVNAAFAAFSLSLQGKYDIPDDAQCPTCDQTVDSVAKNDWAHKLRIRALASTATFSIQQSAMISKEILLAE